MSCMLMLFRACCFVFALLLFGSSVIFAAPFEFTVTAKTAFDQMADSSSSQTSAQLKKQYDDLQMLQQQVIEWDGKIRSFSYRNKENTASLRKRIHSIDAAAIHKLNVSVAKAKQQYEPLLKHYETKKEQLKLAKAMNNKELAIMANAQVELARIGMQAARMDIKAKEGALKKAKSKASAKKKAVRDLLATSESAKWRMKAAKSSTSHSKKQFTAETKELVSFVRKGDAVNTGISLTRLLGIQRLILEQKAAIYHHEEHIAAIIATAEAKLYSYGTHG